MADCTIEWKHLWYPFLINYQDPSPPSFSTPDISVPNISVTFPTRPTFGNLFIPGISDPVLNKRSIIWGSVDIPIPSLSPIEIPEYTKYFVSVPSLENPDYLTIPEKPSEIDWNKFKPSFLDYESIYIPFYRDTPEFRSLMERYSRDLYIHSDIPENELSFIDVDFENLLQRVPPYLSVYSLPNANYLTNLGIRPINSLVEEYSYFKETIDEFIRSLVSVSSLSVALQTIKDFIASEKLYFAKHLSKKEREFLKYELLSYIFAKRVVLRDEYLRTQVNDIKSNLQDIIAQNEGKMALFESEIAFKFDLQKSNLSRVERETRLTAEIVELNEALRGLFRLWNQAFVIITTMEALNVERDRAVAEKMIVLAKLDEARTKEDIVIKEREVLLERDKVYTERINVLNAYIEKLRSVLSSIQNRFEASWSELEARFKKLQVQGEKVRTDAETAGPRANLSSLEAYLSAYSSYVNSYIRVMREYIRAKYDVRSYRYKLLEDFHRAALGYYRAFATGTAYFGSYYQSLYDQCEVDLLCAQMLAQAKISAQIIEAFA